MATEPEQASGSDAKAANNDQRHALAFLEFTLPLGFRVIARAKANHMPAVRFENSRDPVTRRSNPRKRLAQRDTFSATSTLAAFEPLAQRLSANAERWRYEPPS